MRITGSVIHQGRHYHLIHEESTHTETWYLLHCYREEDRDRVSMGLVAKHGRIPLFDLPRFMDKSYVIGAVRYKKIKGLCFSYGNIDELLLILEKFNKCKTYSFREDEIVEDLSFVNSEGLFISRFSGKNENREFSCVSANKVYQSIWVKYDSLSFSLDSNIQISIPRGIEFEEVMLDVGKKMGFISIEKVTYDNIPLDLTWTEGKDYRSITNIKDFEEQCIGPMVLEILKCKSKGERCLIGLDTETTGFNLCYLPKDHPAKDHVVTLQLSWKDNQGVIIFFDMEYFDNMSIKYALSRLQPLFQEDRVAFDYPVRTFVTKENGDLEVVEELISLHRDDIRLTGHNTMFDGKACYDTIISDVKSDKSRCYGGYDRCRLFFDEDTLQMVFNINPTFTKGHKGLKDITRKFFNHETPELSDILGKGNEDKFKYLSDEKVARIYGCADTDYSRLSWKRLYNIMDSKMYHSYQRQDTWMWFILYESEYYGLKIDEDRIKSATHIIEKDLETIKQVTYDYLGYFIFRKMLKERVEAKYGYDLSESDLIYRMREEQLACGERERSVEIKITGAELRQYMYKVLRYPQDVLTKTGEPAVNKDAMKKLMEYKLKNSKKDFLKKDILSEDGSSVLVDAKKFAEFRYPLAYLVSLHSAMNKEYTGYYKPFKTEDIGGRIFRSFSLVNIETRRISHSAQTIKKLLKKCIIPSFPNWRMGDSDYNQIEARNFVSMAKDQYMIDKLNNPENDYHTENAGFVFGKDPWMVTSSERGDSKKLGFGIPYGLGARKMCENLYTVITDMNMFYTKQKLLTYKEKNHLTMAKLESFRDEACRPWNMPKAQRDLVGISEETEVSHVTNLLGFHRVFDLDHFKSWQGGIESVRRQAGNFPIQSFAAEIFRTGIRQVFQRITKEGLRQHFLLNMLIHDEILFSFSDELNVLKLMEIIKEEFVINIEGHCTYLCGLNFGENWYEAKQDDGECPSLFLDEMVERFKKGELGGTFFKHITPKEYLRPFMKDFFKRRVDSCLAETHPSYKKGCKGIVDIHILVKTFSNYTVRSYLLNEFGSPFGELEKDTPQEVLLINALCAFSKQFEDSDLKLILSDNKEYTVVDILSSVPNIIQMYSPKEAIVSINKHMPDLFLSKEDVSMFDEWVEGNEDDWSLDFGGISNFVSNFTKKDGEVEEESYKTNIVKSKLGSSIVRNNAGGNNIVRSNIGCTIVPKVSKNLSIKKTVTQGTYVKLIKDAFVIEAKSAYLTKLISVLGKLNTTGGKRTIMLKTSNATIPAFTISEQITLMELDKYVAEVYNSWGLDLILVIEKDQKNLERRVKKRV